MFRLPWVFLLLFGLQCLGQDQAEKIKVGYAGSAPFVIDDKTEGIVFDIWKQIAYSLGRQDTLLPFNSVEEGISAIKLGSIDILIGPTTINSERASEIAFSQPYYNTEMAILAPVRDLSVWERIRPVFSETFLFAVIGLLLILTLVGFLFWLVEGRRQEDVYGEKLPHGIGSGIWLAIVTMTTVGYGDYAPRTPGGRIVMGAWMVVSLILATSFVAGIATTFSQTARIENTITSMEQLKDQKVAVPDYQKIMSRVRNAGGTPIAVNSVTEGYKMLLDRKVDALIYDEVPLEYIFETKVKEDFVLSKRRIEPQYYGFVFPVGSSLKREVDVQIIRMQENQEIINIVDTWISKN